MPIGDRAVWRPRHRGLQFAEIRGAQAKARVRCTRSAPVSRTNFSDRFCGIAFDDRADCARTPPALALRVIMKRERTRESALMISSATGV